MQEQQNIELKESWRDEYLKWICGFANAQGGKIYIGKNDKGEIVGIDKTFDLLKTKYLKAEIRYEGASRIEEFPFPAPAFREALLNAIAHKDYSSTTPIQISVYENKMIIWNQGQLPENWTIDKLTVKHPSVPYNPKISNALFRSGYIEAWGRGTINMINECAKRDIPLPSYKYDFSGFIVEFTSGTKAIEIIDGANKGVSDGVIDGVIDGVSDGVKEEIASIVDLIANNEGINANNIVAKTGNKSKSTIERYLKLARDLDIIEFEGAAKTGGYYLTRK